MDSIGEQPVPNPGRRFEAMVSSRLPLLLRSLVLAIYFLGVSELRTPPPVSWE